MKSGKQYKNKMRSSTKRKYMEKEPKGNSGTETIVNALKKSIITLITSTVTCTNWAEERNSELKNRSFETIKLEEQKEKKQEMKWRKPMGNH